MPDIQIITSCTQRQGLLPTLESQLEQAGLPLHVEPLVDVPNDGIGNLGMKLELFKRMVDKFAHARRLIFVDAFDVLFYGNGEDVWRKLERDAVWMGAERNCWPDSYLAPFFNGDTPWRYVNGGLTAGSPEALSRWIREIEKHPAYHPKVVDQQWFNFRRLEHSKLVRLDTLTELFYCCCLDRGELQFENGVPINTLCGTSPNFIHFNGKTDPTTFTVRHAVSMMGREECLS